MVTPGRLLEVNSALSAADVEVFIGELQCTYQPTTAY